MKTPNHSNSSDISHTKQACSDCGEEKLPFKMKKPSAEPGSVQAVICCDQNEALIEFTSKENMNGLKYQSKEGSSPLRHTIS